MIFQRKNHILSLAIAATFAGGAGIANAALLDGTYTARTTPTVASEVPTTGIVLTAAAGNLTAGSAITQFAPASGQALQVSVTLDNGAKFIGSPVLSCLSVTGSQGSAGTGAATLTLGGNGSNQSIFTLASGAFANTATLAASGCFVSAASISVTGAHNAVNMTITYTYGTLASSSVNGTYINFASGLKTSADLGTDQVAQVGSGFVTLSGATTLLSAGLTYWKSAGSAGATGDITVAEVLTDALGATSGSITVAGATLGATKVTGGVWLQTVGSGSCASGGAGVYATAVGGVSPVTFTGLDASAMSTGLNVCMTFTGTTAIPASSITATMGGTAISGYSLPTNSATTIVTITRNGTTLVAPLVNVPTGWISRLALTNRGATAAAYTVSAVGETGTTVTLTGAASSGSIAASSTTVIDLATLMTAVGTAARASLLVTISGTTANIDGVYQLVNAATGSVSNYVLDHK